MYEEIRGDHTGRAWRYDLTRDVVDGVHGSGPRFRGTAIDDGSTAWIHALEKDSLWKDDISRLRHATILARRPEVRAAATIRQLLDTRETDGETGDFGFPGTLIAVWEWADLSLHRYIHDGGARLDIAEEVEQSVRAALRVLHGIGWIHLDVAPNNVLRVDGRWKLADLDLCARRGAPIPDRHPPPAYRHPDRAAGVPARDQFDFHGLEQILRELRRQESA